MRDFGLALFGAMVVMALTMPNLYGFLPMLIVGMILIAREPGTVWIAIVMPTFGVFASKGFELVNRLTPVTYDGFLASLDFGIAPAVRSIALSHWWMIQPLTAVYMSLSGVMLLAVVLVSKEDRNHFLLTAVIGLALCPICYLILPAVGPAHVGQLNAPRNCMPSMHCTWAFLILLHMRGWKRYPAAAFAALTVLATLATGEHYTPDLLAAIPWTWALMRLASPKLPKVVSYRLTRMDDIFCFITAMYSLWTERNRNNEAKTLQPVLGSQHGS